MYQTNIKAANSNTNKFGNIRNKIACIAFISPLMQIYGLEQSFLTGPFINDENEPALGLNQVWILKEMFVGSWPDVLQKFTAV